MVIHGMLMRQRYYYRQSLTYIMLGGTNQSSHGRHLLSSEADVESPKQYAFTGQPIAAPSLLSPNCDASVHAKQRNFISLRVAHSSCGLGVERGEYIDHQSCRWRLIAEDCLWLASAAFILYYGDFRSDFFSILAHDARILRTPLRMGLACSMLHGCVVMLFVAMQMSTNSTMQQSAFEGQTSRRRTRLKYNANCNVEYHDQVQLQGVDPIVVMQVAMLAIGSTAFILMCITLWPVWSFLTIPMLFTLLMALTVVAPYIYILILACSSKAKDLKLKPLKLHWMKTQVV
ncbi:hypothetical protein L7F22_015688 [Adiantum nelumboides]|nr:hypothetical protein [Adiantum nelumboides]